MLFTFGVAPILDELRETARLHGCGQEFFGAGAFIKRLVVLPQVAARDVEARQWVHDRGRVHVRDEVVEMAKRRAALKHVLRTLRRVEGVGGEDARDHAPHVAVVVRHVISPILRLDDARHLPHAVVASGCGVRLQLLVAVVGYVVHVPHDGLGLREHSPVDLLHDHLRLCERVPEHGEERVVDVPVAERDERHEPPLYVEPVRQQYQFHDLSPFLG